MYVTYPTQQGSQGAQKCGICFSIQHTVGLYGVLCGLYTLRHCCSDNHIHRDVSVKSHKMLYIQYLETVCVAFAAVQVTVTPQTQTARPIKSVFVAEF